ncbi:hypothetical protein C8J56DRAFT_1162352 [Mycena floridula]|nr:hypothetical protein C8J56DRAFT_1162352 [Mycena floridula]
MSNPLESLRQLAQQGRAIPGVQSSSPRPSGRTNRPTPVKPGQPESLSDQIEARCSVSFLGISMATIIPDAPLMEKGPGPLQNPPIPNGMTDTLNLITKIVITDYPKVPNPQFWRLPKLLGRVRHLLRVHYDFVVTKKRHPEMIYCDWDAVMDIYMRLHRVGLCLQLDPPRFNAVLRGGGPELEALLLDDELDIGPWRKMAAEIRKSSIAQDEESEERSMTEEKRWAKKAMKRLVHWSTDSNIRDSLGDPLTDSMRPIYWSKPLLIKFAQAGGLAALFGDWINSTCKTLCEETLKTLPDEAWENQTKASLNALTLQIQHKVGEAGSEIANCSIMVNAFWNMYKRYGLKTLHAASRHMDHRDHVLFYYLYHRINKEKIALNSKADWRALLTDFVNIPKTTDRRYHWLSLTISGKWDCIEYYGCAAQDCPEKKELLKLRAARVLGVRDPEIEERLDEWGRPRACPLEEWTQVEMRTEAKGDLILVIRFYTSTVLIVEWTDT